MARSTSGDSLLTRVMRILEVFGETPTTTVTEIAARTGLPVATAHRLVGEMVGFGLLERDENKRVRMGVRLWELSLRSHRVLGLREAARPYMEDLQSVVHQHVQISVRVGTEVLYIERLSSGGAVANIGSIAARLPIHACSPGLVLLAHAPEEVRAAVLAGPLEALTPHSLTDPVQLRRTVATVRRTGFAVAPASINPAVKGVAVPLRDGTGAVVASLSIVIPMTQDHRPLVPALMAAGRGVSRAMGAVVADGEDVVHSTAPAPIE
ncbi:IclR family transcriptional regulator [Georgenia yuyongxinii]|uniref:IclR family transcriptional regulator n=1 Tax=Georgenia yuyongxinii TaxID=2589797 RepID=A0A552WUW1_9MICO|nr:IclR family transcriptional regulator [Georgenia yuyongxinii]TRW46485.1 IclR family transcriptional regulator [Georgenia yuyongxinii]